ncbi:hypothetical protein IV417_18780 [Alphaproteobacteria bacterium KMM 3653]|uniref:Enolase C-terminal domain-containing protein n=1 Tax=Harenicola maris TaxID=2841044 RepID=A0AAP2G9G5_9RHOB|nr:hypothetical protein [Harenicola maris]
MGEALEIKLADLRIGLANVHARIPFRFGNATIRHVSQAVVEVEVETRDGARAKGYAADFLSYAWFDKRPGKTPAEGSAALLASIQSAGAAWLDAGFGTPFALWRDLHRGQEEASLARGSNRLSGNFGVSMIERAVIDAVGRLSGLGFHDLLFGGQLGIEEPSVFAELPQGAVVTSLPLLPRRRMDLRHTVGLIDPLTAAENTAPLNDGLPETLEDYLRAQGLRSLKVKIGGDVEESIARLKAIAALLARVERPVTITLDGNEQFASMEAFAALAEAARSAPELEALWRSVLFVEQPVEREAAMQEPLTAQVQAAIGKPLIIDESDGWATAFKEAMALGYCGVSHKNCKGVFRSFLNNALAAQRNEALGEARYFLSAEDLSCLPVVSLNADLAAAASLGIGHIERNGHHYFNGLKHLSLPEQDAAIADYGGLYARGAGGVALAVHGGAVETSGLFGPGFGVRTPPDMDRLLSPQEWQFDA